MTYWPLELQSEWCWTVGKNNLAESSSLFQSLNVSVLVYLPSVVTQLLYLSYLATCISGILHVWLHLVDEGLMQIEAIDNVLLIRVSRSSSNNWILQWIPWIRHSYRELEAVKSIPLNKNLLNQIYKRLKRERCIFKSCSLLQVEA